MEDVRLIIIICTISILLDLRIEKVIHDNQNIIERIEGIHIDSMKQNEELVISIRKKYKQQTNNPGDGDGK